jgi:hypothetical protein
MPSADIYQASLEQLAAFGPPTLPEQPAPPVVEPTTTTAPPVEPPPPPPPVVAPRPPKVQSDSLSLTGTNLWNGLIGKQVRLEMKGGQAVTGVIVAQSSRDLAVARTPDGTVVAVPKAEVAGVRLRVDAIGVGGDGSNVPLANRPTQNGRGAIAGGVVMVSVGSILALTGTVFLGISPSAVYINLPLLLPGLAIIGGGSALIHAGGKKKKAYDKAWGLHHARLTPTFNAGRNGGSAGLVLRF